eukprot:26772_1
MGKRVKLNLLEQRELRYVLSKYNFDVEVAIPRMIAYLARGGGGNRFNAQYKREGKCKMYCSFQILERENQSWIINGIPFDVMMFALDLDKQRIAAEIEKHDLSWIKSPQEVRKELDELNEYIKYQQGWMGCDVKIFSD